MKEKYSSRIHIGTSGWHYSHWRGPFYPEELPDSRLLAFYSRHFKTVEVNNSFYRLPEKKTLEAWCRNVPGDFTFAVKASRYITHMKKLKDPGDALTNFFQRIELLGKARGPVLFQLPPRWNCDPGRLREFLERLGGRARAVFEFRDSSWFRPDVYRALAQRNAAFCIYDLQGAVSPRKITADFTYIRLHGPGKAYEGRYSTEELSGWAGALSTWARQGLDVYCYFDNDQAGYAARNAENLCDMLS